MRRRSLLALALAPLVPALPAPRPQNIIFLSGEVHPFKIDASDRRFFVVEGPATATAVRTAVLARLLRDEVSRSPAW